MKICKINLIFQMVAVAGLFLTQNCGTESSWGNYEPSTATVSTKNDPAQTTNTSASPNEMKVGDIYSVTFDSENSGTIDFNGVSDSSEFILSVASLNNEQDGLNIVSLTDISAEPFSADESPLLSKSSQWDGWSVAEAFDQELRNVELNMADDPANELAISSSPSMSKAVNASASLPNIGDAESFKVLGSLSSLSSYKTVQAKAKCIGDNVIFYVDTQVETFNPQDLSNDDVKNLCATFDKTLEKEFELFGSPSDINNDSRVVILMTPQVNRLGAMGGGIITGFFYANDLYSNVNSNKKEIVYIMVPDSAGKYGTKIPKQFAFDNLLPAVIPHEVQHLINYNQKVLVNKGRSEEGWLNEGLSHLAEDILGYGQENPSRMEVYLENPSSYGIAESGNPGLAQRGGIYLFLRYLYEQAENSNAFIWNLLHTSGIGIQNVEESFAGKEADFDQFQEFMLRWTTAMIMSSLNLSNDERFSYQPRTLNSTTGHYEGVCLNCEASDGRGTVLNGIPLNVFSSASSSSIEPTAADFYQLQELPAQLNLNTKSGGTFGATLIRYK